MVFYIKTCPDWFAGFIYKSIATWKDHFANYFVQEHMLGNDIVKTFEILLVQTPFCIEMILSFSGFFTAIWLVSGKMEEKDDTCLFYCIHTC